MRLVRYVYPWRAARLRAAGRLLLAQAAGRLGARAAALAGARRRICRTARLSLHLPAGDRLPHRRAGHLPARLLRRPNTVTEARPTAHEPTKKTWRWEVGWTDRLPAFLRRPRGLGRAPLPPPLQPAAGRAADLRRRQAVDVEGAAPRRPARDQRAARPGRTGRAAGHGVAGRDPQLLHPGAAGSSRTSFRAATRRCGSAPTRPAATICSAPNIAAPTMRTWAAG